MFHYLRFGIFPMALIENLFLKNLSLTWTKCIGLTFFWTLSNFCYFILFFIII